MQGISNNQLVAELHIGTLEGLSDFALNTSRLCFEEVGVKKITLDILDLNELEANFLSGNLDLIFTSKSPGRQKFKYLAELGFQRLERIETSKKFGVLSTFEYGRANKRIGNFSSRYCFQTLWLFVVLGLIKSAAQVICRPKPNEEKPRMQNRS